MEFQEISALEWTGNFFDMIGRQWMLVGVEDKDRANLMTASWGGAGILWARPVVFTFVRRSRHTHDLLEAASGFSLTFYGEGCRKELGLCGSRSGRDVCKAEACGFSLAWDGGIPYTREAKAAILCKKVGKTSLGPDSILDKSVLPEFYADGDYHDLYIGEIAKILVRQD